MQTTILCIALAALVVDSVAFMPSQLSLPTLRVHGIDAVSRGLDTGGKRENRVQMSASLSRRDVAKIIGGTALSSAILIPAEGQCKQKKGGDGGKWARHYGEFLPEELEGFTDTSSGLKYKDVVEGDGGMPTAGNSVQTHYSGYLLESGNLFDSSYERGKPLSFKVGVGQVIKGWDEALLGMKVGGKRQLIIPATLGYGARAVGPIPSNSALFFYVELLAIGA